MSKIKYTPSQEEFYRRAMKGESLFLQGRAGTGKTFISEEVIRDLRDEGRGVVVVATSGIAAVNIGGQTIHSLFQINPYTIGDMQSAANLSKFKKSLLKRVDTIVIDEVSMLRPDVLDSIDYTLKRNLLGSLSSYQVIFIGDLKQLQPIYSDEEKVIITRRYGSLSFKDAISYKHLNPTEIELDEIVRQDDIDYIKALEVVRNGGSSEYFSIFESQTPSGVILAPHNATVDYYNTESLNRLEGKERIVVGETKGKFNPKEFIAEEKLVLKDGASVMHLINKPESGLVNGTLGTLKIEGNKYYFINSEDGTETLIERHEFKKIRYVLGDDGEIKEEVIASLKQFPIKLAYAITINKSQGLTFDKMTLDLTRECFADGQEYVALSRVRKPSGLTIIR